MEALAKPSRQPAASRKWPPDLPPLLLLAVQLLLTTLLVARNGPVSVLAALETDGSGEEKAIGPSDLGASHCPRTREEDGAYPSDLCGVWQGNYTRLHALIRTRSAAAAAAAAGGDRTTGSNGEGPPARFLTFVWPTVNCGGFGDSLVGLATSFLVALLDNRAFLIGHRCFAYAFNPAFIDWRVSPDVPMEPTADGMAAARGENGGGVEGKGEKEVVFFNLLNKEVKDFEAFFGQWRNAANLQLQWNRGRLTRMLQGVGLRDEWKMRLKETGLRIPYAFGCILRYILRPKPEVMQLVSRLQQRLRATQTGVLGLHLRVPDHVAWKGADGISERRWREGQIGADAEASRLLSCAQAVEEFWLPPSLRVVWLFVTNSDRLKSQVEQQYPSKVLVTDIAPVHGRLVANESLHREVFVSVATEWLLFSSCCERYVVSSESGFSKTAVLYGMKPDRLHASYRCTPESTLTLFQLGDSWSGI